MDGGKNMAFQRALWRSGLTYRRTCDTCRAVVMYMDDKLDFRPWFPDGFVYCPICNTPLRHNECYAINAPAVPAARSFCTSCGNRISPTDTFCSSCGKKIDAPPAARVCPNCGKVSENPNNAFCTSCGHKF